MTRAIIFANGSMKEPPAIVQSIQPDDLIIAADGGTHHCQTLGITPRLIIGDFDSLEPDEVTFFKRSGVETLRYPSHKDETDLELALQQAFERGVEEVYIIGALGDRWDMTIANILLIAHPTFSTMRIHLLDGRQELFLLRGKDRVDLHNRAGEPVSLIPLDGDAHGVTTHGLVYPLIDESLYFSSPRGVSNVFSQDDAQIEINDGLLLCIYNSVNN